MINIKTLRAERKAQKMTQKTVAEELGISETTMCFYDTGKWDIPLKLVNAYAELVGLEVMILKKKFKITAKEIKQSYEEKMEMYMKLSKKELVEVLIERLSYGF